MAEMNSPMKDIPPVPSATSTPGGTYDKNPAAVFGKPRSTGGLPIKMTEEIGGTPGKIDTTFGDAIEMGAGPGAGEKAPAVAFNTPMKALD